ncbi:hypothetical protein KUCAC02_010834, partial [Chaenocephalus aceratus]
AQLSPDSPHSFLGGLMCISLLSLLLEKRAHVLQLQLLAAFTVTQSRQPGTDTLLIHGHEGEDHNEWILPGSTWFSADAANSGSCMQQSGERVLGGRKGGGRRGGEGGGREEEGRRKGGEDSHIFNRAAEFQQSSRDTSGLLMTAGAALYRALSVAGFN